MSDNWQRVLLKTAHAGGFWIEHRSSSPFASEIVAMKLYQTPTLAVVGGVPEMRGGEFVPELEPVTVIEKAGRYAVDVPSLTLIRIFEYVPTSALVGMSDSWQRVRLKTAHAGAFWIEHLSSSPSASEIVAMKLYQTPTLAVVAGVPDIRGVAANALSGVNSTATNETANRAKAIVRARANAHAFFDDLGMHIPIN
jgi:hypothetical protein